MIITKSDDSIYRRTILRMDTNSQRSYITRELADKLKREKNQPYIAFFMKHQSQRQYYTNRRT